MQRKMKKKREESIEFRLNEIKWIILMGFATILVILIVMQLMIVGPTIFFKSEPEQKPECDLKFAIWDEGSAAWDFEIVPYGYCPGGS